jgi:FAD:protein FMN transferase
VRFEIALYAMTQNCQAAYLLACVFCVQVLLGCRSEAPSTETVHSFAGSTMGTVYNVRVVGCATGSSVAALQQQVDLRLAAINQQMSTYLPDSEISCFNRHAGDDWFSVSAETALVVAAGQQVSRDTQGAFDVTVGPLVNLWGFGPAGRAGEPPSDQAIAECQARVGYALLEVRQQPPALRKRRADLYVDLSAIAKGFAVDEVAKLLERHAVRSYLVEIGGEVRTKGRKPDGGLWRIGIERPVAGTRQLDCAVELDDRSLATSGDYRNFVERQGRRYSHEIDPRTGRPVDHALISVSVLADDCLTADAWATALLVLGPDAALPAARRRGVEVLCMIRSGDGWVEHATPGFAARICSIEPEAPRAP